MHVFRLGSQRRVSKKDFRPTLGEQGTALKLEHRIAAVSFVGVGTVGDVIANAISAVTDPSIAKETIHRFRS
jgi:hypothetical protein